MSDPGLESWWPVKRSVAGRPLLMCEGPHAGYKTYATRDPDLFEQHQREVHDQPCGLLAALAILGGISALLGVAVGAAAVWWARR